MSLKQRKQILDDPTISISNIGDGGVVLDFDKFYLDFKNKIKSEVSEILIGNLQEDVFLTEKEYQKAPYRVKGFLNYSEKRGLRYYLFDYKGLKYMFIGAFGSSGSRANESFFEQLTNDPDIKTITETTNIKLSQILKNNF